MLFSNLPYGREPSSSLANGMRLPPQSLPPSLISSLVLDGQIWPRNPVKMSLPYVIRSLLKRVGWAVSRSSVQKGEWVEVDCGVGAVRHPLF